MKKTKIIQEVQQIKKDIERVQENIAALERYLEGKKKDRNISCFGYVLSRKVEKQDEQSDAHSFASSSSLQSS